MKTYKIAIIGAGQIGSRHLQSLAVTRIPLTIEVVDPSRTSLATARQRFGEVKGSGLIADVQYFTDIAQLSPDIDLAIVATSSLERRDVIFKLAACCNVRLFILEKVLFQCPQDYSEVDELLETTGAKAWINCPRRMFPFYQSLRERLAGANWLELSVTASDWGLACNGIHYVDLFAYLTGNCGLVFDSKCINGPIEDKRRQGFIEFWGTLAAQSAQGRVTLTSYPAGSVPGLMLITSDVLRCAINEVSGQEWYADESTGWQWQNNASGIVVYQSQLTNIAVDNILSTQVCPLPEYRASYKMHLDYLRTFLNALNSPTTEEFLKCSIT